MNHQTVFCVLKYHMRYDISTNKTQSDASGVQMGGLHGGVNWKPSLKKSSIAVNFQA